MKTRPENNFQIIFFNPPVIEESTLNAQPIPLGLISINMYLNMQGYDSQIINLCKYKNWGDIYNILVDLPMNYVGIPCFTRQRFSVIELAKIIKKINPYVKIWLGGPHVSFLDKIMLEKYEFIDYIVRGEGEITSKSLADYIIRNIGQVEHIDGITFRNENNKIIRNKDRAQIKQINCLPLAVQSLSELETLNESDSLLFHFPDYRNQTIRIAPVIASRGCDGVCTFCCNRAYWGKQRFSTVDFVCEQINYYYKNGIRFFDFYDDNFTNNHELIYGMIDYIISKGMDIYWWCSSRVDTVDKKLLETMKLGGCFMISYGVESGSQTILNNIHKGIDIAIIKRATELAKSVGLDFRMTISIGHKGENLSTIQDTIDLLNQTKPKQIALFLLKVYPGTPIYEEMVNMGLLSDEYWFDSTLPIVPFYTIENSEEQLLAYRKYIEDGIVAKIVERYEDELGSVEMTLDWGEENEKR